MTARMMIGSDPPVHPGQVSVVVGGASHARMRGSISISFMPSGLGPGIRGLRLFRMCTADPRTCNPSAIHRPIPCNPSARAAAAVDCSRARSGHLFVPGAFSAGEHWKERTASSWPVRRIRFRRPVSASETYRVTTTPATE
jgi:hypothetical protein